MDKTDQIRHLYFRAGFGIHYPELKKLARTPPEKAVRQLLEQARRPEPLAAIEQPLPTRKVMRDLPEEKVKQFLAMRRQQQQALNIAWMERLAGTPAPLSEKMTLFWHGHFACRVNNGYYLQQLNNIHRTHALGNFRTLLTEVSRAPAMLSFLNNQQNRKGKPNENFARELMELFTLGRGHYTEGDIKEAARAFTGWQFDPENGEFRFNERQHDHGAKTFFGKTGNFNGEDIINILLENKQTARFLSEKLYRFFVNDVPGDAHVQALAEDLYASGYEIERVMEKMLTASWFYEPANVGNKIKSPVELLVGLNRQFGVRYNNPQVLVRFQRSLGQTLFYPPNVAGWPGGKSWIDSSTLLKRMKLPSLILNSGLIEFDGKADPEDEAFIANMKKQQDKTDARVQSVPQWDRFLESLPRDTSKEALAELLIALPAGPAFLDRINGDTLKDMAVQMVSTPEYQLC